MKACFMLRIFLLIKNYYCTKESKVSRTANGVTNDNLVGQFRVRREIASLLKQNSKLKEKHNYWTPISHWDLFYLQPVVASLG